MEATCIRTGGTTLRARAAKKRLLLVIYTLPWSAVHERSSHKCLPVYKHVPFAR